MIDFTKVPNIHYWTQRVLPCVFDESLSYVEKINKLEEEINKLIEEYNTFGQNVVTEINTFEEETTNQINAFIEQVTNEINTFKSDITNQLNTFETTITNRQNSFETTITNRQTTFETTITNRQTTFETRILELTQEFETAINNDIATFKQTITAQQEEFENRVNSNINTMQETVNEIPNTVTTQVNAITQPWLVANVPAMVESIVANNVNKVFDVDQLYNSGTSSTIGDINNWTDTGIYFGTTNSEFLNFPDSVGAGYNFWCIVGHSADTSVYNPLQQNLYISNGNIYYRSQSDIQAWDNWYKSNISVTNIPYNTAIDFNTYFYKSTEVANGDMWIATFQSYDKWLNAPSGFKVGDIALITNDILYAGGTIINVERVTKIGNTSPNAQYIGKTWSRCKVGTTWLSWNPTTLDYQYKEILTNTQLNKLTETGIYTISSESGVTIGGLPSTALQYGSFYIRVTANNIGTNSDEIIQEIINAGPGASSYTREKQGAQWSNWHVNPQKELLWSGVATVTNPYTEQGYTHIETSGITDVEISDTSSALSAFVASHEVIVSVSNASATSTIPPVTTGFTFGITTDEITGKKVVKINVVLENMTAAGTPGTAYYVSYKLYKVN
jgi:archaellum component FlaC|nr:MAG TPA: apolipoprotein [Caudoviricetes sp.]